MTIRLSPRTGGIDMTTIYGKHDNIKEFDEAYENELKGTRLMNSIPLTRWGAKALRDALTKAIEAEV